MGYGFNQTDCECCKTKYCRYDFEAEFDITSEAWTVAQVGSAVCVGADDPGFSFDKVWQEGDGDPDWWAADPDDATNDCRRLLSYYVKTGCDEDGDCDEAPVEPSDPAAPDFSGRLGGAPCCDSATLPASRTITVGGPGSPDMCEQCFNGTYTSGVDPNVDGPLWVVDGPGLSGHWAVLVRPFDPDDEDCDGLELEATGGTDPCDPDGEYTVNNSPCTVTVGE